VKTNYQEQIRLQAGLVDIVEDNGSTDAAEPEELSTSRILKVQWLGETVTRDMFKAISDNINTLEERARQLAYNYNNEQKHLEIINLLVRATELRNIRETYGK
jgi:hypothetical protein